MSTIGSVVRRRPGSLAASPMLGSVLLVLAVCGGAAPVPPTEASDDRPRVRPADVCEPYGREQLAGDVFMAVSIGSSPAKGLVAPPGTFECTFLEEDALRAPYCRGGGSFIPCSVRVLLNDTGAVRTYETWRR